jgi:hypothetical protein
MSQSSEEFLSTLKHRELQKLCRERNIRRCHTTKQAMIAAILAQEQRLQQIKDARERRVKNFEKAKNLYRFWSQTGGLIPDDEDNKLDCRMCKFLVTGMNHDGYCSDFDLEMVEIEPYFRVEILPENPPPELEDLSKSEKIEGDHDNQFCHYVWCPSVEHFEAVEILPFYNPAFIGHKFSLTDLFSYKNEEEQ